MINPEVGAIYNQAGRLLDREVKPRWRSLEAEPERERIPVL